MRKVKKLPHRLMEIEFLDHAMNAAGELQPIECRAIGELVAHCKDAWYLATWFGSAEVDHNSESFTILKKVVTKMTPLYRGGRRGKKRKAR